MFNAAVSAVFDSVDTPEARRYRAGINAPATEEMGIIIQPHKGRSDEYKDDALAGYVNTMRHRLPEALDVVFQRRKMPDFSLENGGEIIEEGSNPLVFDARQVRENLATRTRQAETLLLDPASCT